MKKLAAILMLIVFLFHFIGYRGVFYVLEQQWRQEVLHSFDKEEYNQADLITIRAPLMLPYVTDTRDFQRVDGEITVKGKVYRFVKSKVENGEYVLLCLPDHFQEKLVEGKKGFFGLSNDISLNDGKSKTGSSKIPLLMQLRTESDQNYFDIDFSLSDKTSTYQFISVPDLADAGKYSPEQPPDYCQV